MVGVIGGTGLYKIDGLTSLEVRSVDTPFGPPSAPLTFGKLDDKPLVFLPRHGESHNLTPSEINYRANLWALKSVGVTQVIGVSAVGSLAQEIVPGELAIPNQYLDWTKGSRIGTFFREGMVAHVSTSYPTCSRLSEQIVESSRKLNYKIHSGQTYACVEGPRLGTRAESIFLINAGCDLVGMTNVPEAFLAREAQMCYCTIGLVTDYDCWQDDPDQHASVDKVMSLYKSNLDRVKNIIQKATGQLKDNQQCTCRASLKNAILTKEESLSERNKEILKILKI